MKKIIIISMVFLLLISGFGIVYAASTDEDIFEWLIILLPEYARQYGTNYYNYYNATYNVSDTWVNESGDTMTGNLSNFNHNISADYFLGNYFIGSGQYLTGIAGGLWLNTSNYLYPNSTFGVNVNISEGNLTANNIFGQPVDGGIGSGVLWSSNYKIKCGCVNITTGTGLNVSYPNMQIRIWNLGSEITLCDISGATIEVPDDAHTVYYVDSSCSVISDSWLNYFDQNLNPSNYARIFDVYSYGGEIGLVKGASLIGMADRKRKYNSINCGTSEHLGICAGIDVTEDIFPIINQTSGSYVYVDTEHTSSARKSDVNGIHIVTHSGGAWTHINQSHMNLTHCDDGSDYVVCSNDKFRRYIVYTIGFGNEHTTIHQLAPLDSEYYNNLGDCMNLENNPLSYTLPSVEKGVAVVHHLYCGARDDTSWFEGWIDLRVGKNGFGAFPDLTAFVQKTGDTMTGNLSLPNHNVSADYFHGNGTGLFNILTSVLVGIIDWTNIPELAYTHLHSPSNITGDFSVWNNLFSINANNITNEHWVNESGDTMTGRLNVVDTVNITENLTVDTDVLFVNAVTNRIGVNNPNPDVDFDVAGSVYVSDYFKLGTEAVLPVASSAYRNEMVCINGIAQTQSDKCYICLKSSGGAGQWSDVFDYEDGVITLVNVSNNQFYAGTFDGYIWNSTDGSTWSIAYDTGENNIRAYGGNDSIVFAGVDRPAGARVYNSSTGGVGWDIDHTFSSTYRLVKDIAGPLDGEYYFGMWGSVGGGDVYVRNQLGIYSLSLNLNTRSTRVYKSGINGNIYALEYTGCNIYEKQSAMGSWFKIYDGGSKLCRNLIDNGTHVWLVGGTPPFIYVSDDYGNWSRVSVPSTITSRYSWFFNGDYWNGNLYIGTSGGAGGGDILKYDGSTWSVDYDTGFTAIYASSIFRNSIYMGSNGGIGTGFLHRLSAGVEGYTWKLLAEG